MKRWSLLIVDDEFRIGMLIQKLIKWDTFDLNCIGLANNGEQALEIIKSQKPDIVITDIRMPKINGLDLIRMTKKIYPNTKFVVISGYKEFDYAYKALKYGVEDYLLKPINEEKINLLINKIIDDLATSKGKEIENLSMRKTIDQSKKIIKENLLKTIIENDENLDESEYHPLPKGEYYQGINIKLDYSNYEMKDDNQDKRTIEQVIGISENLLHNVATEVLICEKEYLNIFCLLSYPKTHEKDIRDSINEILIKIKEHLMGFEYYEVTIGVGKKKDSFGDIRFSITEAQLAIGNRIQAGTGKLILADLIIPAIKDRSILSLNEYQKEIISCIDTYSKEKISLIIKQIFKALISMKNIDYSQYYHISDELIDLFFNNIGIQKEDLQKLRYKLKEGCNHCFTISRLQTLLIDAFTECFDYCISAIEAESTRPVRQAKKYIDEHYSEKITLEDIAEIVGLNPVYFSVVFKKETGLNYSSYLIDIRIEKAKQMISETNETISSIAENVGYKDYRYFSQLFTKSVGVKPALYRKLHS